MNSCLFLYVLHVNMRVPCSSQISVLDNNIATYMNSVSGVYYITTNKWLDTMIHQSYRCSQPLDHIVYPCLYTVHRRHICIDLDILVASMDLLITDDRNHSYGLHHKE